MGRYYILRIYFISVLSRTLNCRKQWPKKRKIWHHLHALYGQQISSHILWKIWKAFSGHPTHRIHNSSCTHPPLSSLQKNSRLLIGLKLLHAAASQNIAHDDFCVGHTARAPRMGVRNKVKRPKGLEVGRSGHQRLCEKLFFLVIGKVCFGLTRCLTVLF